MTENHRWRDAEFEELRKRIDLAPNDIISKAIFEQHLKKAYKLDSFTFADRPQIYVHVISDIRHRG